MQTVPNSVGCKLIVIVINIQPNISENHHIDEVEAFGTITFIIIQMNNSHRTNIPHRCSNAIAVTEQRNIRVCIRYYQVSLRLRMWGEVNWINGSIADISFISEYRFDTFVIYIYFNGYLFSCFNPCLLIEQNTKAFYCCESCVLQKNLNTISL